MYNSTLNITCYFDGPVFQEVKTKQLYMLLPSLVYTMFLVLLGVPGNLAVILVYLYRMEKTSSRRFFVSLALCDFLNCFLGNPFELTMLLNFYTFDYPAVCKISRFSNFFLNNVSACLLTTIAVNRYRRVKYPLKPPMTSGKFRKLCFFAVVFSFVTALPSLFIYGTRTTTLKVHGMKFTYIVTKTCHVDDNADTSLSLAFSLYLLKMTIAIFVILVISYTLIAVVVFGRQKQMTSLPEYEEQSLQRFASLCHLDGRQCIKEYVFQEEPRLKRAHSVTLVCLDSQMNGVRLQPHISGLMVNRKAFKTGKTTFIMCIVSTVFMLSFVPYLIIVNLRYLSPDIFTDLSAFQWAMYHLTVRSYMLNSAVNPVIYCFLNGTFRQKVKTSMKQLVYVCRNVLK